MCVNGGVAVYACEWGGMTVDVREWGGGYRCV